MTYDKQALCWGKGTAGQLGNNTRTLHNTRTPVKVRGHGSGGFLSSVKQIASGRRHTCALKLDGEVRCWGEAVKGQLGHNSYTSSTAVVTVLDERNNGPLEDIGEISTGHDHNCALRKGYVLCWGAGEFGQLGHDNYSHKNIPVKVLGVGRNGLLSDVYQIDSGSHHTCALKNNGNVVCWGLRSEGRLGDGDDENTYNADVPVAVMGLSNVQRISAGNEHTCALKNSGKIFCWGSNEYGELGHITSADNSYTPLVVGGESGENESPFRQFSDLMSGKGHSCATTTDGKLLCWGGVDSGQSSLLGRGSLAPTSTTTPLLVLEDDNTLIPLDGD